jgi:hypothetical protein
MTSIQSNSARALRLARRTWLHVGNMCLDSKSIPVEIVAIKGSTVNVRRASDGGDQRNVAFSTLREIAR